MSARDRLTLSAAFAVAMGTAAVVPLYADLHWLAEALGAVAVVALTGLAARRARLPGPWAPVLEVAALAEYLGLVFASGTLYGGVLLTRATGTAVQSLLHQGTADIARLAPPVPSTPGLTLIAVLGVGAVALAVDLLAVTVGRTAIAGLPLLVLFAVPSAVLPGGLGWLPFAFGAVGWLTLLLTEGGGRVGRWGTPLAVGNRPDRSNDDASAGRAGRRIGFAALSAAVVLPSLVPGLNSRLLADGGGNGPGRAGSSTTTTYNPLTRLREDLRRQTPRTVLVYSTDDPRPDYLRLTTLDRFSDAGWSSSTLTALPGMDGVAGGLPPPLGLTSANTQPVLDRITITNLDAQWLPVPFAPTSVQVSGPWLYDQRSETVFGIRVGTQDLRQPYEAAALRVQPDAALLEAASAAGTPAALAAYTQPPAVTPLVARLTEQVVGPAGTAYDKALAIQAFFRDPAQHFVYSLSPRVPGINSPSALQDFLQGRRGFCEQYASAMAAMLRVAGVPARVAVGFTAGTPTGGGSYRVTTDDAHAWPEAWFAGAGWVRFEPTPRADGQVTLPAYTQPAAAAANPFVPSAAPSAGAASGGPRNPDALRQQEVQARKERAAAHRRQGGGVPLGLLGGLLLVVGLGALPRALHEWRRRRRWRTPDALAAWQQVREDATDLGHRWRPGDSPRAAAADLAGQRPSSGHVLPDPVTAALGRLVTATERARYARASEPDVDGPPVEQLRADCAVLRSGLRTRADRRTRWRAALLPPSTLQCAATVVGNGTADVLDRTDEVWLAVRRRLHLRAAG